jgi:hypothetical protein
LIDAALALVRSDMYDLQVSNLSYARRASVEPKFSTQSSGEYVATARSGKFNLRLNKGCCAAIAAYTPKIPS